MLTSPSERERHHSASSERCPTNAKAVIMTIQHKCRRALIWCQSNLQANYVGFIIIFFFPFLLRWIFFWHFPAASHLETICLKRLRTTVALHTPTQGFFLLFLVFTYIYIFFIAQIQSLYLWIYTRSLIQRANPKVSDWKVCQDGFSSTWLSW